MRFYYANAMPGQTKVTKVMANTFHLREMARDRLRAAAAPHLGLAENSKTAVET